MVIDQKTTIIMIKEIGFENMKKIFIKIKKKGSMLDNLMRNLFHKVGFIINFHFN